VGDFTNVGSILRIESEGEPGGTRLIEASDVFCELAPFDNAGSIVEAAGCGVGFAAINGGTGASGSTSGKIAVAGLRPFSVEVSVRTFVLWTDPS